jgi:hypothetical protein
MIVTVHQPEHLPWLGFFHKMSQADLMVLLDTTQFAKDDFQNRNRIKTERGPVWLTVPVYKKGRSEQRILDVEICNERNWRHRTWSLIEQSYRRAPCFCAHRDFFQALYAREWTRLVDLNVRVIEYLAQQLGLGCRILRASDLGIAERGGTEVNLAISRRLGAAAYLSGRMGRDYLDEKSFAEAGIEVRYQDFQHPTYPQQWGGFVSHLSALDLLFNCGEVSLEILCGGGYEAAAGEGLAAAL